MRGVELIGPGRAGPASASTACRCSAPCLRSCCSARPSRSIASSRWLWWSPASPSPSGPRAPTPRGGERIQNPKSFHKLRDADARRLAFLHDAEAARHLGIGLDHAAEVAAEAILVELVVGLDVPEAARIGADLVGDDDAHRFALPEPAAFDLE